MPQPDRASTSSNRPQSGRSAVVRALAACWLIAFAALTVGIPLLDARMEHADNVVVHLEDVGAASCPAAHSPDCIACHVMNGGRSLEASRPTFAMADAPAEVAAPASQNTIGSAGSRAVPSTRAPPQA